MTTKQERSFIAYPHEVRAILAGRQSQFTRVVKAFPAGEGYVQQLRTGAFEWCRDGGFDQGVRSVVCPFGGPGTKLWVKEAYARLHDGMLSHMDCDPEVGWSTEYRADGFVNLKERYGQSWRSPVTMPRKFSRIALVLESVRAERLQEISEEGAIAEGVDADGPIGNIPAALSMGKARYQFANRWCEIHGPGSWDANAWVWRGTFRVEGGIK